MATSQIINLDNIDEEYQGSVDEFLELSGLYIPISELQLTIHQPRLYELALLTESIYTKALATLIITKDHYKKAIEESATTDEEKARVHLLDALYNIDLVFNSIVNSQEIYLAVQMLLMILFPDYNIIIDLEKRYIQFTSKKDDNPVVVINRLNYNKLLFYIKEVFNINKDGSAALSSSKYNPVGKNAERIAAKLEERAKRLASMKKHKHSALCNSVSTLAVALKIPIEEVYQKYTLIQLHNQLARFNKQDEYYTSVKYALAGAKDVEINDWRMDI